MSASIYFSCLRRFYVADFTHAPAQLFKQLSCVRIEDADQGPFVRCRRQSCALVVQADCCKFGLVSWNELGLAQVVELDANVPWVVVNQPCPVTLGN